MNERPAGIRFRPLKCPHVGFVRPVASPSAAAVAWLLVSLLDGSAPAQQPSAEPLSAWRWFRPILTPDEVDSPLIDLLITPEVFSEANLELNDLRIYDAGGREVPHALRVRQEQYSTESVPADVFNRSVGPEGSRELSLDLGATQLEHNEVEVLMPGENFRRRATLDGSPDGEQWRLLAEAHLIRFVRGGDKLEDLRLSYPPSRFRYLRLRVYQDPAVDEEPVEIERVTVLRRIAVPGETLQLRAELDPWQPTREYGAPASAWMVQLGGDQVPVDRIEVDVPEEDFVRDFLIRYAGPAGPKSRFETITTGTWQRRSGEVAKPLVAEFGEVRAARLQVIVIDHSNPPLSISEVRFAAPARQVVLPRPEEPVELRLYYGNPNALSPRYDFARNMPARLDPPPTRTALGAPQENPLYIPEPVPVTERWPWMIYVVLATVSVVLGVVILSVAQTTIALHDSRRGNPQAAP